MPGNRVEIKFEHRFSRTSNNGQAFGWLKENLGPASVDAISNVIRFVYLPIALAEAGASRQQVEAEIKKSREFFNEKMTAALGACREGPANEGAASYSSSPVPSSSRFVPGGLPSSAGNGAANGNRVLSTDFDSDDDFLELDEDKLMEG